MITSTAGLARAKREGWAHWIRSEADEEAVRRGMRFDQRLVDRVVAFGARLLRHCEGPSAGLPFTLMDWQHDQLFGPLFGWQRWSEHYQRWVRRYDRVYVEVAKKNGKSPTGAYIGLYELVGDEEPGAKVFSAATDKDQASIVHGHAINMAESSPRLMDLLRINRTTKAISFPQNRGVYRVISSNPRGQEGLNANCIIADELHVWRGRELWDAIKYAFASRPEPIFFAITTAALQTAPNVFVNTAVNASVANSGYITAQNGTGVRFQGGGSVANSGSISGTVDGVYIAMLPDQDAEGFSATVANEADGEVSGGRFGVNLMAGGSVENDGSISGG
ncbi:MAG TPA: terminase large subunit, partial [Pirellulaceae bacterium]|nr:terminase large subunit [Pirellulaceae bacterium]